MVVISDWIAPSEYLENTILAEFTLDEVLCHELIHFAANANNPVSTRCVEEEIAYGKSINYLRSKGRTDDFIIDKNMMPYLFSVVDKYKVMMEVLSAAYPTQIPELARISAETKDALIRNLRKQVHEATVKEARIIGQKMIDLYGDGKIDDSPEINYKRDLLFDDDM
jgi:hypothetical protein